MVDGTWNAEDVIILSLGSGQPLFRVSGSGGRLTAMTALDDGKQETGHQQPQFLPDGRRFLYVVQSADPAQAGIYLDSLDKSTAKRRIAAVASPFAFAPPGYLLFLRDRSLMAQRVDLTRLDLLGQAQSIGEDIDRPAGNPLAGKIATSRTNILAYSNLGIGNRGFVWVDREGKELGSVGDPGQIGNFDLSPDETRLVFHSSRESRPSNIWELDLRRGVTTQLTSSPSTDTSPVWSPTGDRIAFTRRTNTGVVQIVELNSTNGQETVLHDGGGRSAQVDDWSPDGRHITFNRDPDLIALPLAGGLPFAFVETASKNVDESHFSPDGKWIAYNSNDRGTWQVYVAPFPPTGRRWQVSAAGGVEGRWRGDGNELYYLSPNGRMMAVDVNTANGFEPGAPRELFDARVEISQRGDHYAVSRNGQRFLIRRQMDRGVQDPWNVIVNWQKLLER
jgi:Tol biopolymer transport system component